ncbi:MAG TPA: N-acetylmuramoyl-L-alanine amidase [Pyrinomonadaceae bacterium]|nr:N-acetylmuramoyl-L-alanine amidase [Pyrinomonadaceae bacterium]
MSKFQVKFYGTSARPLDYGGRQRAANVDSAIAYIEHHFNGGSAKANYCLVNVGTNAGAKSKAMAAAYVGRISNTFGIPRANNDFAKNGVSVGGYKGRGNANLVGTRMPAMLLEPLFATNPTHAAFIKSADGQQKLAAAIATTVRDHFPDGGLVAFSVGHKYKASAPHDRGVAVAGGGTEADYAEKVLQLAAKLLTES